VQIAPRICHCESQAMYSECSRFHPNQFTFGGAIPERVNTIKTGRIVFPIFGWSLTSSRIIIVIWNHFCNFYRGLCYGTVSVYISLCTRHTPVFVKRINVSSIKERAWQSRRSRFLDANDLGRSPKGSYPTEALNKRKVWKLCDFQQITLKRFRIHRVRKERRHSISASNSAK